MPSNLLKQELRPADPRSAGFTPDKEVGFFNRVLMSLKTDTEGKAAFLERTFGPGSVATDRQGNLFVLDPNTNQFFPADEARVNLNDLADFVGDLVQAAPNVLGPTRVAPQAALGGVGAAIREGLSAITPGGDGRSIADRALAVAGNAALAGSLQFGANKIFQLVDAFKPSNVAGGLARRAAGKNAEFTEETARLVEDTGVEFTPGQATGSRALLTTEGVLRRNPVTADDVFDADQRQLVAAMANLDRQMNNISTTFQRGAIGPNRLEPGGLAGGTERLGPKGAVGAETAGNAMSRAFDTVLSTALTLRSNVAKKDFALVDSQEGIAAVIPANNALGVIDDLIARFDVPGGGDATAALVNQLKSLRGDFGDARQLSGQEMGRLLEIYGSAAKGTGQIFKDIDKGQQKGIARSVHEALLRDLDDAVETGAQGADVANALRVARNNYRANSAAINQLEESILGRIFGNGPVTPERAAERLLNMRGSELRQSFVILNKADPNVGQQTKRFMIESALDKSGAAVSQRAASGESVSPAKVIANMEKSPVWEVLTNTERKGMSDALKALERIADRANTEGSPTAPLTFAWELVKAFGAGVSTLSLGSLSGTAASVIGPRKAAQVLFTKEGREALKTISKTDPDTAAFKSATSVINRSLLAAGLIGAQQGSEENVRPLEAQGPRNLLR